MTISNNRPSFHLWRKENLVKHQNVLKYYVTYFDSFGFKHFPKEIKKFIRNKNITTNSFRIQAYDSIMWGYFCIGFTDFMLKPKSLIDLTNFFSANN